MLLKLHEISPWENWIWKKIQNAKMIQNAKKGAFGFPLMMVMLLMMVEMTVGLQLKVRVKVAWTFCGKWQRGRTWVKRMQFNLRICTQGIKHKSTFVWNPTWVKRKSMAFRRGPSCVPNSFCRIFWFKYCSCACGGLQNREPARQGWGVGLLVKTQEGVEGGGLVKRGVGAPRWSC